MLFHSTIRKELARSFGVTLVVLTTVVMTITLIKTLGQAARGNFNPSDVMLVMGYTVLAYMPTILTLSLFIAIIASLSRMYRDSEMVIWRTSGRGLLALLGPTFRFAWPVLMVVMALALLVLPWSNQKISEMRVQYEKRGDLDRITPGQFQESAGGKRVFFIEKDATGKLAGSNVFIATTDKGKESVTSARSGRVERVGEDRFIVLSNGQRLESTVGQPELKISEFEEYSIKVGEDALAVPDATATKTLSTMDLLDNPTPPNRGELSWRFGLILAAINFVIIGIAAANVNPRAKRSADLLFPVFAFLLYYNLLTLGRSWIATEQMSLGGFMLALHGGAWMLGLLWLLKGHNNWHLGRLVGPSTPLARSTGE